MAQELTTDHRQAVAIRRPMEGALTPSLPPALRLVLGSGERSVFLTSEGGGIVLRERLDWMPPTIDGALLVQAQAAREALLDHLSPMDDEAIGIAIGRLKAHNYRYARREGGDLIEEALDVDWIEDLREFPQWAIDDACRQWRRTKDEPPTIASLRALCDAAVADDRRMLRLLTRLLRVQRKEAA